MPDVFSKAKRSEVMARVRSRGNETTELALSRLFRKHKITGWRRRSPLFGRPDFVFPTSKLAIFVDGCFWHGCPQHASLPATRRAFWLKKFATNKARDHRVTHELRRRGWHVLRIWEHELRRPNRCLARLFQALSLPVRTPSQQAQSPRHQPS